jgi:type I restriction enzyme S subunit
MSELPRGWATAVLGEVAINRDRERVPVNAEERSTRTGNIPYYGAAGQVGWIDEPLFDEHLLLLGEDGVQFFDADKPKAYMISGPSWVNNHAHVLSQLSGVSLSFLMYFLNQFDYHGFANGTTRLKLTRSSMDEIPVRLAPSAEQERIVAAIEEAFSKLDAGEAGLRTVRQLLKRMRDAILTAAVTGRLVPQDPTDTPATRLLDDLDDLGAFEADTPPVLGCPPGWSRMSIGELIGPMGIFVDGDWVETKDQDPTGDVRLTQLADIGVGVWRDRSDRYMTSAAAARLNCTFLEVGDVLVARMPDPLGRACLFPGDPRRCVTVVDVAIIRPNDSGVDPTWLMWMINSPAMRVSIESLQAGTTRKRISRKNLAAMEIFVPPVAEQRRIVAEVEHHFSFVDACERAVDAGLARSAALRRSMLKAAFEGRLVPQDPSDEPASVLLERIRAERAAAPGQQGKRRKKAEAS